MGLGNYGDMGGSLAQGAAMGAVVGGPWGAAIGGALGLAKGLIGSKAKNKAKRRARKLQKAQMQIALDQANRAKEGFLDESARQEQDYQQSFGGRGIESSSIQREGMDFFGRARDRAIKNLDNNIRLAHLGKKAWQSADQAERQMAPMNFLDSLIGGGAQGAMLGMGVMSMFPAADVAAAGASAGVSQGKRLMTGQIGRNAARKLPVGRY